MLSLLAPQTLTWKARASLGSGVDAHVDVPLAASVGQSSLWSFLAIFRCFDNSTGSDFAQIYSESGGFPKTLAFQIKNTGILRLFHRDAASVSNTVDSLGRVDGGKWTHLFAVRSAATVTQMYLDYVLQGTGTNNPATYAATSNLQIGGNGNAMAKGSAIARVVILPYAIGVEEARNILSYDVWPRHPRLFMMMGEAPSREIDRSIHGYHGTVTGFPVVEGPPRYRPPHRVILYAPATGGTLYPVTLTGGLTPAGSLTRLAQKALAGGLTPSGALAAAKVALVALAGGLTPSGLMARRTGTQLAGSVAPAGTVTKAAARATGGTVTPSGSLVRLIAKAFLAAIAPAGSVLAQQVSVAIGWLRGKAAILPALAGMASVAAAIRGRAKTDTALTGSAEIDQPGDGR